MAVYSMTGYASAQMGSLHPVTETEPRSPLRRRLGLEIRSVNGRFLDLSLRLPDELRQCEPVLRERLSARLKRGKVELRASFDNSGSSTLPEPSLQLLQRLALLQDSVRNWLPEAAALSTAEVLRLAEQDGPTTRDSADDLLALAEQVLSALCQARAREGQRLADTLLERLHQLRALARQAAPLLPQLVQQQRERFLQRWQEALGPTGNGVAPEAAQDRALAEATAFAIRIDVAEELTRLEAHLDEIERLLGHGGEVGKRLDFLIQELHREANTLGAKSSALELSRIAVEMKVLIEQMREQVQNLE